MADFTQIIEEINTNLPDNTTQSITAEKLRETLIDLTETIEDVQDEFEEEVEELIDQKVDAENDIYITDYDVDYGNYWIAGGTKHSNANWACVAIDVAQYAGKTLRVRAGDSRNGHHAFLCFVKLSDNSFSALSTYLVADFPQYSTYKLPNDAVELELSYSLSSDVYPLKPSLMVAYEELDGVVNNLIELVPSLISNSNKDYLTLRGIDFNVDGADPNMGKFIKHLSFDIPSSVKNHILCLRYLGINNSEFYLGIFDKTENKLIGNARKTGYDSVPQTGIEEFNFVGLISSSSASYQITNIKLVVDWDYYPGYYNGNNLYYILPTNDKAMNLLINQVNSLLAGKFDLYPYGSGYYYNNSGVLEIRTSPKWMHKSIDIQKYRGKILRLRAGDFSANSNFNGYCYFQLDNNSLVGVIGTPTIFIYSDYSLIRVPENAVTLFLSWGSDSMDEFKPILHYEPNDDGIYSDYASKGYVCSDIRYNACILGIDIDIPANKMNHSIVLRQFGVYSGNNRFYVEAYDMTEDKRLGYGYYGNYNPIPNEGVEVFDFTSFTGGEASYQLTRLRIAIDWSKYNSDMYFSAKYNLIYLNYVAANSFFYLYDQTKSLENIDIESNIPVLPSQLFLLSDKEVPLYKNSLMTKYKANIADIDINIKSDATAPNGRKILEINEPTYFSTDDFGDNATIFLQRSKELNKLIYKDVRVFKKNTASLSGKTFTLMALGDSLTQGTFSGGIAKNGWRTTPPCMVAQGLLPYNVTTQFVGSMVRTYYNEEGQPVTLRYEGRGGWRYRTYVGLESKFAGVNQYPASSQTKHEYVEGVDGTINEIKQQNPFLYPATEDDLTNNPEWCFHFVVGNTQYNKSYAEDSTLGDYVIFDPVRYFSLRQIDVPDILTIALGTNEWYLNEYGGFDNAKATACAEFMIKQFRKVSANMNIVVIPLNNFPTSRESDWENYAMPLCSNVIRICDELIAAGDEHLFICPIYAQGSRKLGYNGTIGSASNLSSINDTKQIEIDTNVHVLYEQDDSNYDYRDSLVACVANLIS